MFATDFFQHRLNDDFLHENPANLIEALQEILLIEVKAHEAIVEFDDNILIGLIAYTLSNLLSNHWNLIGIIFLGLLVEFAEEDFLIQFSHLILRLILASKNIPNPEVEIHQVSVWTKMGLVVLREYVGKELLVDLFVIDIDRRGHAIQLPVDVAEKGRGEVVGETLRLLLFEDAEKFEWLYSLEVRLWILMHYYYNHA